LDNKFITQKIVVQNGDEAELTFVLDDAPAERVVIDAEIHDDAKLVINIVGALDSDETIVKLNPRNIGKNSVFECQARFVQFKDSKLDFTGLMRVENGAKGANADLHVETLLLSGDAFANLVPSLEIEENEVAAGHGAVVKTIDADQLFYLQSRGIEKERSKELIVEGFLGELVDEEQTKELYKKLKQEYKMNKVARTVTYFADEYSEEILNKLQEKTSKLEHAGFTVQTTRICFQKVIDIDLILDNVPIDVMLSIGTLDLQNDTDLIEKCIESGRIAFNVELGSQEISDHHVGLLFRIMNEKPEFAFNFTYVFNNAPSSPYFPSANYQKNGFGIGLQPTDLSVGTDNLADWLENMKSTWNEIHELYKDDPGYLGIDSSIAPLFEGESSLINYIDRITDGFPSSVTSNIYTKITKFIKADNPKPLGLSGLMFPCLEDFELASYYEKGEFSIERNVFLSLHSGLGIDTYPIGVNENPGRVKEVLNLIKALSNKYLKPLSARFVSDGKARIGDKSDFKNQYLKDVTIREL